MIKFKHLLAPLVLAGLAGCAATPGEDYGFDAKLLKNLKAQLWTDPNGCQHWYIDDGAEGYLTARLQSDGRPVCPGATETSSRASDRMAANFTQDATLWTDPKGCQHWVSDHGFGGYMTQRLSRDGKPVCPGAQQAAPSQTITLNADALFDTDKSELRPEAIAELDEFGAKAKQLGKQLIYVEGHTDSRASDAYNLALSERRAEAVASYLEQNFGLTTQTNGKGEGEPVASNDTAEGRQANRRVEITLLD